MVTLGDKKAKKPDPPKKPARKKAVKARADK